jgi:hypothetical protein
MSSNTHFSSFLSTFGAISSTPHESTFGWSARSCHDVEVSLLGGLIGPVKESLISSFSYSFILIIFLCWIAGRRHTCLGGSIQNHKNKDSLYGRRSLESGRIVQIVYKYRASPTVRSIDFIIQCTTPKDSFLKWTFCNFFVKRPT